MQQIEINQNIVLYNECGDIIKNIVIKKIDIRYYKNRKREYYHFKCNVCGWEDGCQSKHDLFHSGCACCKNKIAVKGINTLGDKHPYLISFFKNKDDAFVCTPLSDKKFLMQCPKCQYEHYMIAKNLVRRHYSCPLCGDGISYPERFFLSMLQNLNIQYVHHLSKTKFKWCKQYIYDFYIESINTIIELHGAQHYISTLGYKDAKSLEEIQKTDEIKKELAIRNGIKNYITIDCRFSNPQWLQKNTYNMLKHILPLENIDWNLCAIKASSSMVIDICKYYETHKDENIDTTDIAKQFGTSRDTVLRYLHRGTEMGICFYDAEKAKKLASQKGYLYKKQKPVAVYDINNKFIKRFASAKRLEEQSMQEFGIKFTYIGIIDTCKGRQKTHRNFIIKYLEE